jgi:hypothetical protein
MASSSSPSSSPPPAERGAEITNKLPSHASLITKTGSAILGSGLLATAISGALRVQRGDGHRSWVHYPVCLYRQGAFSALGYEFVILFSIFFSLGSLSVV